MPSPSEVFDTLLRRASADAEEDDLIASITSLGIDELQARRAFMFIQTAWARSVLSKLPVKLSREYILFDKDGRAYERKPLMSSPWFVAASDEAERLSPRSGFDTIVTMSAEFNAVNNALLAGSQAEDLVMLPVYMNPPDMSDEGWARARAYISADATRLRDSQTVASQTPDSRPWWKLW